MRQTPAKAVLDSGEFGRAAARWSSDSGHLAGRLGVALAVFAAVVGTSGCAKGCSAPPAATLTPDTAPRAMGSPGDIESQLKIQLLERKAGRDLLAGWHMLPWRRLRNWRPDEHLVVRVGAQGLSAGAANLEAGQAADPDKLAAFFSALCRPQPSGNLDREELVLALDAQASPEVVAAVRVTVLDVAPWRVVLLARDGEQLVEVQLNPPRASARPPQVATPTTAP